MGGHAGTGTNEPLKVLIVEDSPEDAELMLLELRRAGLDVQHFHARSAREMAAALDREPWDVILCDYTMPDFTCGSALSLVRERGLLTPLLVVSATVTDEAAIEAMKAGARDIIMKNRVSLLPPAVLRELEYFRRHARQRSTEEQMQRSERHFRALIEHSSDAIWLIDREGKIQYTSPATERMLGYRPEEVAGRDAFSLVDPESLPAARERFAGLLSEHTGQSAAVELRLRRKDGAVIWAEGVATNLLGDDAVRAIVVSLRDVTDRKRTQHALEASQERFSRFMRHLPDAAWIKDASGRYIYANPMAEAIFGTSSTALAGKTDEEMFPAATAAQFRHNDRKAVESGQDLQTIETLRYPDGSIHNSIVNKFPIPGPEGSTLVGGVAIDITEQQRAQQKLRESEQCFRALVENSADGFALLDPDGVVRLSGPPILGYESHEFAGRHVAEIIHPEDAHRLQAAIREVSAAAGATVASEYRIRHKNGTWRWVATVAKNLMHEAAVGGIVVNYRDITQRRAVEEELRERAQLLDLAHDAILSLSWTSVIEFWNRGAEEVYGWKKEEAIGRISYELLHTQFPEPFAEIRRKMVEQDRWEGELLHTRRDGAQITVASRWALRRDAHGEPSGYLEINSDITARKLFDEQLRQTQKLESLGVLAGGIAHDFNNLLTGILGNATLALNDISPSSRVRSMLEDVVRGSERAANLTRQLLAYSGKGRFVIQPVDLTELVEEMSDLVRLSIPKTVQLRLELDRNLPAVEADASQMQQLVMNLVINGAEAIGEARYGTVFVVTRVQEVDADYLRTALLPPEIQPGRYVLLEVQDNGEGMDQATMTRIFDPFFTTKFTGRGLGLAAALGIVRGHRGAIKVYSAPGRGTTFKVLFPPTAGAARADKVEQEATGLAGSGMVLVVDDEEMVRNTAKSMLERYGYSVLLAENGRQAVDLFHQRGDEIAMVLLDLTMPVMSGEETLRHLRALRADVRIVLSSGYNEVEAVERFAGKGLAGFLQKPYTATQLLQKVSAVLRAER